MHVENIEHIFGTLIQDIQDCINHFLGTQNYGLAADVNEEGNVNGMDVQETVILF